MTNLRSIYFDPSVLTIQNLHILAFIANPLILKHILLHHSEVFALALIHLIRAILGTLMVTLLITLAHLRQMSSVIRYINEKCTCHRHGEFSPSPFTLPGSSPLEQLHALVTDLGTTLQSIADTKTDFTQETLFHDTSQSAVQNSKIY